MFKKKLEILFLLLILVSLAILINNYYQNYTFKNNDIPQSYKQRIADKEQEVLKYMQAHYNARFQFPLIVTDKFQGKLYGLTSYRKGEIKIYLNKKVMQESMDYMVESVIAHEYAHALMFKFGFFETKSSGHSQKWKEICINLGGADCRQYVNRQEIILSKIPFK
ncbi:MAG: sprT domain-containing protein [Sulfurimonas sp.]|nr:MAG: sprT domain-containing protein [Sulfurimonas sp.]